MKRFFSILFAGLIFLNAVGFYGLLLGLQFRNSTQLRHRLNAGIYDSSALQKLKVPFKTDPVQYSENYKTVDGEFEKDGNVYRLIKQRHYRDTFYVVFIKDETGTAIHQVMDDLVSTFTDGSSTSSQTLIPGFFIKEYFTKDFSLQQSSPGWNHQIRKETHATVFIASFNASIVHPPESV